MIFYKNYRFSRISIRDQKTRILYKSKKYRTFIEYIKKVWTTISTTNTATFLSKDFWHEQPTILTNNGYYLIRTGKGHFAIFDEKNIFFSLSQI
jgi:hypothetical protein